MQEIIAGFPRSQGIQGESGKFIFNEGKSVEKESVEKSGKISEVHFQPGKIRVERKLFWEIKGKYGKIWSYYFFSFEW